MAGERRGSVDPSFPFVRLAQRSAQRHVRSVCSKLHGVRARAEPLRDFAHRQPFDSNEVEGGPLRFREAGQLRPRPVGELQRLELLFCRRTGDWLIVALLERLERWRDASSCPARFVDGGASGDGECPRDHVCSSQEARAGEMQLKHRLLQQIRGCCRVGCTAPHVRQQAWRESGVEFRKRAVVTVCIAIHRRVCRSPRLVVRDGRRPTSVGSAGLQWRDLVSGASQASRLGGHGPRVTRPRFVERVGRGRCKGNGAEKCGVVLGYGTLTERGHAIGRCTGRSIWPSRRPRRPRSGEPFLAGCLDGVDG
jgi:hypothetical protein